MFFIDSVKEVMCFCQLGDGRTVCGKSSGQASWGRVAQQVGHAE